MKCDISRAKNVQKILKDEIQNLKSGKGEFSPSGLSNDLATTFYESLLKDVKTPEKVMAAVAARYNMGNTPLHKNIIKEVGEVIQVTENGKTSPYYLLGSNTVDTTNSPTGRFINLEVAPVTDISNVSTMRFDGKSNKSIEGINKIQGEVSGIRKAINKALKKQKAIELAETVKHTPIKPIGDPEVENTLRKMQEVDEILGSRQQRTTDSLVGYHKIPDYKHGDIESMRAVLSKLHVLGNSKADNNLMTYYSGLLDKMHQRFFNEVDVYFKDNQVDSVGYLNLTQGNIVVDVAKSKAEVYQSEAEVYMHEVIHSMVGWALRQPHVSITALRRAGEQLMLDAQKATKWEDLLTVPLDKASQRDIENAKHLEKLLFEGKNNLDEFIALAVTNPQAKKHFEALMIKKTKEKATSFLGKIIQFMGSLITTVKSGLGLKKADLSVFESVNELAFKLAEANTAGMNTAKNLNGIGIVMEALQHTENNLASKMDSFFSAIKGKDPTIRVPELNATVFEKSKFYLGFMVKVFTNKAYQGYLGMWANKFGMKPGGTVREFLTGFFSRDELFKTAEKLGLLNTNAQAARNAVIGATSRQLLKNFKNPLNEYEDSAITSVLIDTNATHLRYRRTGATQYEDKDFIRLLTDPEYRKEREGRAKYQIRDLLEKDEERGNWTVAQAVGLGYLMATGKGTAVQVQNAEGITRGFGSMTRYKKQPELQAQIEELASIIALNYTDKKQMSAVAELIKTETKGINEISNMYESYKEKSKTTIFKRNSTAMMTGHSKELLDNTIDSVTAPISKQNEMEAKGYKLEFVVPPHPSIKSSEPMGFYITNSWGKADRLEGAVAVGGLHAKGTTLSALKFKESAITGKSLFERDLARMLTGNVAIEIAMREGTYDVTTAEQGLMPLFDRSGNIVDFRYMMNKESKKRLFKQDTRASEVLPRSVAAVEYQIRTEALNKLSLDVIKQDMIDNWEKGIIGKDSYSEYILIGPKSVNEQHKELYYMLPESFREHILAREDKTMAVRADIARIMFGDKHLQISSLPGYNQLPTLIKTVTDMVQGLWEELVKVSKGAILIKIPAVLVLNISTNIIQQIASGHIDIKQLFTDYKDSMAEVADYLKHSREANTLTYEIESDIRGLALVKNPAKLKEVIEKKRARLNNLNAIRGNNPAKALFDAGLYQSYLEDMDNTALGETNRLVKAVNSKLDRLPKTVRTAVDVAYMTQNTSWYRGAQEILQRSDMITRLVDTKKNSRDNELIISGQKALPLWWTKEKKLEVNTKKVLEGEELAEYKKVSAAIQHENIVNNYINYTLPNGKFEEFLNRMGVLMFTKYLKRIQRVITQSALSNPIKTALIVGILGGGFNMDLVQDSAFVSRLMGPDGTLSIGNLIGMYSPLYHMENVLMPALIKDDMLGGLF